MTEETKEQSYKKFESNAISDIATKLKKENELLRQSVLYLEYHGKLGPRVTNE